MKMMVTCSNRRIAVAMAIASAMAWSGLTPAGALASETTAPAASSTARSAVAMTRDRGVPAVLLITSRRLPASSEFARQFLQGEWARQHRGLVQVLELVAEDDPELVSAMGVATFPTAVVYRLGDSGLVRHLTDEDCASVAALAGWLGELSPPPPASASASAGRPMADPALVQASHADKSLPSPQSYSTPSVPSGSPTPQYGQPMMMSMVPQMASTPASVISVPSQNFVIQQQAPQVFMSPAQSPMVYVPQQQVMAMAPASAPTPNLFLPASQPSQLAMAPQPTQMMAAQPSAMMVAAQPSPMMMAAQPSPMMMAAAPPTMALAAQPTQLAAVSNQQMNLPTSASRSRVRVRGPGMLASAAARFGERLTRLGRVRIVSEQETTLEAPLSQASSPGMTTISTTSAVPLAQPSTQIPPTLLAPPVPCNESCTIPCPLPHTPPEPPGVRPSSQGAPHHHAINRH
ncbi:hypothetical protein ElP_26270 [Tautonia plasticadhaerens]|uniref:Thioredoxin domain-containing protein n=2 Tax=Tautonia plasticadhaerens TaxID=2527974 RepID=A0A518H1M1_9BACT|nr:hypothetical protein ElP_26270 [Tautonia plasticadhaerens]